MIGAKESILLDTDIGSDIDDALALAYLLRHPACELVGITTVTGEPHMRAALADAICRETGREDIPIHVGACHPLLVPMRQSSAAQAAALKGSSSAGAYENRPTAVDFLRATIRARPGELTLVAIGPLTNVALLFALDPLIPSLLKRLVLMGGQFAGWAPAYKAVAEWNILCDPHAAAIVFASDAKITAVGLDVTTLCSIPAAECREQLSRPGIPTLIAPMAEIWLQHAGSVVFHDPLAAAVIFEPQICGFANGKVEVELTSDRASGMTYWTADENGLHTAATTVDRTAFFEHYFQIVTGNP